MKASVLISGALLLLLSACATYAPVSPAQSPGQEVRRAAAFFQELQAAPDSPIPEAVLRNAKGLVFLHVYKAGFGLSGRGGGGFVVARTARGWSGPSFVGIGGVGFGLQAGVKATEILLVLNTRQAVEAFARGGNVTLTGDLSAVAGPVGRTAQAGVTAVAPVFAYGHSKGAFLGVSLEGTVLFTRPDANREFYGREIDPGTILSRRVRPPAAAQPLLRELPR